MASRSVAPTRAVVTRAWRGKVDRKVDDEICECLQYYHRISAVTLVSTPFPVFLGIRFQQPSETEVAAARRLGGDRSIHLS